METFEFPSGTTWAIHTGAVPEFLERGFRMYKGIGNSLCRFISFFVNIP